MRITNTIKRIFTITIAISGSIPLFNCGRTSEKKVSKPNIIFIYTDDQAPWAIGASGNNQIHTPNLDKLASEGAYFNNAFTTTPVCSPARVSLMTSQYASEYGILDFIPSPGHILYDPKKELGLTPESVTFPELLQKNGYNTGLIGKYHLGDWTKDSTKKFHPTNNGFDYFMGLTGGGTTSYNPTLEINGTVNQVTGYTTNILTDYAIEFIKSNTKAPFLLCVNYRAPHGPWLPVPDNVWELYDRMDTKIPNPDYPDLDIERVKKRMKEYLASVSGVDKNIGRILDLLDSLKLEDNTIIIFSSDHGYNMGHNGIEHKGNGYWITKTPHPAKGNIAENSRPNMFDNSLKVPAIVKWPGVIKPGTVIENTISVLDWYPTIVDMAESKIPIKKIIRGRSLVPLLKGDVVQWDNDFYAEYSMINYSKAYMRTYRTPTWKLTIDFLNEGRNELYNLELDSVENNNLFNAQTPEINQIIYDLLKLIIEKMIEINDPLLQEIEIKKYSIN